MCFSETDTWYFYNWNQVWLDIVYYTTSEITFAEKFSLYKNTNTILSSEISIFKLVYGILFQILFMNYQNIYACQFIWEYITKYVQKLSFGLEDISDKITSSQPSVLLFIFSK